MVSKSICTDDALGALPWRADFIFGRCLPHLDREGRMPGNPSTVRALTVPLREEEITLDDVTLALCDLADAKLIQWYHVDERRVLQFPGFKKHQRGLRYEQEAESRLPGPTVANAHPVDTSALRTVLQHSNNGVETGLPRISKGKLSEAKGSEETDTSSLNDDDTPESFLPVVVNAAPIVRRNGTRRYSDIIQHISSVMAEVATNGRHAVEASEARDMQAEIVFAYWAAILGHDRALLDQRRLTRLKARLTENHGDVHELLFTVDGARRDSFLMGKTGEGKKYDGIETVFRDRAQVERLSDLGGYKAGIEHPLAKKYASLVALP